MNAIDAMSSNFITNRLTIDEVVCLEDHTEMGPVVHENLTNMLGPV